MSKNPTVEIITQYIAEINRIYKAGNATEHTYRPALKTLLEALMPRHTATNEPKRIACGAPDYIITDRDFAVGYVEAKNIPVNLNDKTLKEQLDRYRYSLDNLIFTNYLTFRWYAKGELADEIAIGKEVDNKIISLNDNFQKFTELISQFVVYYTEGIKTSSELSKQMAAKARLLAEIIENSLNKDIENKEDTELNNQYEGFKSILIDTISTEDFSDLYAQTIAYGMFAARINYNETGDFTREKAVKSIPQTNPFLRKMFGFIAGVDLDSRISWVVDTLADMFNYVDIEHIHKEIGRYADNDPIIHFYETFLTDYDKRLKKQRGVWYTPQPVVRFIVSAVNEILKTDFGIVKGLADNSKVTVGDSEYHKVQILDPATGTGTFLAEIVEQIYSNFTSKGMWNNYVNEHLIPRLNGFEILMASYAMAHLKLEMLLQETNAEIINDKRLRIYLTDSLDEANDKDKAKQKKTSILKWLTDEANEAATIKRDTPVMVILGNPPYSVSSSNKGKWIADLCEDYKKNLNERNIQPLSDDYIKFIRLGQHYVEKNGFGILAYISNNSFIDGLIHRQMRKSLLETFDKIYILDLHGNAKKKETAPDGGEDKNVFDIMQGVSISIFVKKRK
ncbi:MAG: N-6 DNA methylase [Lentimicrobiaceae bacterium]|nr:N-6 DNA methylase [Lentimicrobiaceae bacterium]